MLRAIIHGFLLTLLRPINPAFTSMLGVLGVVWGLWMMAPWWDVFATAQAYRAAHLTELIWGLVAVLVGACVIYGALRPSYVTLAIGSGLAGAFWFWVCIVFFIGDWRNTGGVTYFFVSLYGTMIYVNVRVNHANGHDWSGRD